MKKLNILSVVVVILLSLIIFAGCTETTSVKEEAILLTVNQIKETPTYEWFGIEMNMYVPDTAIVNQIKTLFNPNMHKVLFYADMTCGCVTQGENVAHIIRVLRDAGMNDSVFKIYSMRKNTWSYPESGYVQVTKLPTAMLMKNVVPVYSVLDTLLTFQLTGQEKKIEELLLDGIKK
ncbi:MAG: hypothetical protein WCT77_04195 [Bacteroidota bacterium]